MPKKVNKFAEAIKENGNLVGLAGAVAASAALLSPLPLLVGLVAEAGYLLFVPDSHWYDSRLSRRQNAENEMRRRQLKAQILAAIDPNMRERFQRLEAIRGQIEGQVQKDQDLFQEVLRKLDYLLEKFLVFAQKEAEFRSYLLGVWQDQSNNSIPVNRQRPAGPQGMYRQAQMPPGRPPVANIPDAQIADIMSAIQQSYDKDIESVQKAQAAETDDNTKAVMQKRIEVLQQRREGVGKIARILTNLRVQLSLVEDTFGLINDQIRARSPEQVLSDIEGVVYQTDSMTTLLEEVAPYEQLSV